MNHALKSETFCRQLDDDNPGLFNPLQDIRDGYVNPKNGLPGAVGKLFYEFIKNSGTSTPSDFPSEDVINLSEAGIENSEWYGDFTTSECVTAVDESSAIVSFAINSPYVSVVEKDLRTSPSDRLGIIGGTIGLFVGLSLISIAEAVYWIIKGVFNTADQIVFRK